MIKKFSKILNLLTNFTHGVAFKAVSGVVALCVAACLFLCYTMLEKIPTKFAFFVDNISLNQDVITIGEGSDISYQDVPKDYLEIVECNGIINWKVNPVYHNSDTLQYFKINDENPNRVEISNNREQNIKIKISSSVSDKDSLLELSLTGEDIWNEWEKFKEQKEILLRHFAVRYQSDRNNYSVKDPFGFMQQKNIRSFFSHKNEGKIYLVILDKETIVESKDSTYSYAYKGICSSNIGTKIQFYRVNDHCYLDNNDDESFKVDNINYVMKASVKLTEWGAGHVMLTHNDNTWNVFFPKAMGYVESVDTLYAMAHKTGDFLTLKQGKVSYPSKNDIYLPHLSSQLPNDICSLEFHDKKLYIRNGYSDSTEVISKWHLSPSLTPFNINTTHGNIQCRIGYIDRHFISEYFLLPGIVAIILILFVIGPFSPVRLPKNTPYRIYSRSIVGNYGWYLSLLIAIAFCYCVCKIMIALKLSYTYPYFEKLTGIIPVSTSLTILLFFTVAMIINTPLIRAVAGLGKSKKQLDSYPIATVVTIMALLGGISYYFFYVLDPSVSKSMISSYYPGEIYNIKIWDWMDSAGINDTHRSVVYALLFVESVALGFWACILLPIWDSISKKLEDFVNFVTSLKEKEFTKWIENTWSMYEDKTLNFLEVITPKYIKIEKAELMCDDPKEKFRLTVWLGRVLGRLPLTILILVIINISAILLTLFGELSSSNLLFVGGASLAFGLCLLSFKVIYIAFVKTIETIFPWHFILLAMLIIVGNAAGNFGTAFITLGVIIGLTKALSSVKFDDPSTVEQEGVQPLEGMWQMLFITGAYIACAMVADNGYLTNYVGFLICFITFYFLIEIPGWHNLLRNQIYKKTVRFIYLYLAVILAILVFLPSICSKIYDPNEIHYNRMARRLMLFSDFDNIQSSGFRYTETDAEFMVVMSHNMQQPTSGDPLSNDLHILHPSVSSGQSPVALNDLSMPLAFFGSYGTILTTAVFFVLLFALLCLVLQFSIHSDNERTPILSHQMQWRLMAVYMWTGTTLYIYLSYLGHLPFTGRLIPGFGVDAVGEAIETALLLAFMVSIAFKAVRGTSMKESKNETKTWSMDDL